MNKKMLKETNNRKTDLTINLKICLAGIPKSKKKKHKRISELINLLENFDLEEKNLYPIIIDGNEIEGLALNTPKAMLVGTTIVCTAIEFLVYTDVASEEIGDSFETEMWDEITTFYSWLKKYIYNKISS